MAAGNREGSIDRWSSASWSIDPRTGLRRCITFSLFLRIPIFSIRSLSIISICTTNFANLIRSLVVARRFDPSDSNFTIVEMVMIDFLSVSSRRMTVRMLRIRSCELLKLYVECRCLIVGDIHRYECELLE